MSDATGTSNWTIENAQPGDLVVVTRGRRLHLMSLSFIGESEPRYESHGGRVYRIVCNCYPALIVETAAVEWDFERDSIGRAHSFIATEMLFAPVPPYYTHRLITTKKEVIPPTGDADSALDAAMASDAAPEGGAA